ncbi:hypothetical protein M0805_006364 [Coniferiporia weirii]|nr:hypothetical protein M0805_006364 [Coniferiporia weirii]
MFHGRELPLPVPTAATHISRPVNQTYPSPPHVQMYPVQSPRYPPLPANPPPFPSPPPMLEYLHKVWILDCESCGKFITNRAMKCVLLLRHDVNLFSSDALPVNCSVYQANSQVSRARTCECLTQTLACHGCGSSIGYMIVAPCSRCTPSNSHRPPSLPRQTRNTNGHRFVFHSTEVAYEERLYVPGVPDVIPDAHPLEQAYENISSFTSEPTSYSHASGPHSRPFRAHTMQPTPLPPLPKVSKLRAGELVYWHHLTRRGDLHGVQDDERSRASRGYLFDARNPNRANRVIACR